MAGRRSNSVTFDYDHIPYRPLNSGTKPNVSLLTSMKIHFLVSPSVLPRRIFMSLVPPIFGERFQHVYVDFMGPLIALILMTALLHYGHASKLPSAAVNITPTEVLLFYAILMPLIAFFLSWLCNSRITLSEMIALLGYGMFGHVFTLAASLIFYQEKSNVFFFLCLILFGGLSTLRVALLLLASIPVPAARLLICSFIATMQLLSLVFLHFAYMHRTFVYGAANIRAEAS